ncbi:TolC family protein [bacterium]|nr:TolC family protein [bacterium]MBR1776064.1 TolC family protein [bacterium]
MNIKKQNFIYITLSLLLLSQTAYADDTLAATAEQTSTVSETNAAVVQTTNPSKKSWFKFNKNAVKLKNNKKSKKNKVEEVKLPPVIQGRPKIPFSQMSVMSIDDCVSYALAHNPSLMVSEERINAAESGIGQARSSYAPRFSAGLNYNFNHNEGTRVMNSHENSAGVSVGISEMIWDFGRTTARINMAKYDTLSAEYDHGYETLNIIYQVRINYHKVLAALANLDIFEQNVRIQTLNFERTKAMFDEGLKSKIDVVNAEVNLADAKIQLVDGQNNLLNAIIALQNSMYYTEDKPFVVKNTESFGFLKADYKKKIENANNQNQPKPTLKRDEDGLITLSSGIEHNDIIQDYVFKPMELTKQEAVNKALELRPDLKSNEILVMVQEEALKAIRRTYAPELTGNVSWSYQKNEHTYTSPLQAGASLGLGSVNPYGIHYQIKEGESYLNIAKHNVNLAKSDIYWEVQNNYINMRQLERKIPILNTKVKASLENFELADGRYSVGLNNYVELQDALASYNNSQLNFVEAVFNYNVARETLLKSMGIGLEEKESRIKRIPKAGKEIINKKTSQNNTNI